MRAQLNHLGIPGVGTHTPSELLKQLLDTLLDDNGVVQVRAVVEGGHWTGADVRALILGPAALAETVASLYTQAEIRRPPVVTKASDVRRVVQWMCGVGQSGNVVTEQQREQVQLGDQLHEYATFTDTPRGPLAFGYSTTSAALAQATATAEMERQLLSHSGAALD